MRSLVRTGGALCLLLTLSAIVVATAQEPDILMLRGKKYFIHTNPLERYLESHPEKRPKSGVISSSNWRGYIATWEVKKEQLYLADVRVMTGKSHADNDWEYQTVLPQLFPPGTPVIADWFSGNIIVPDGKRTQYVHMGYASTYERYIIIRVVQGKVEKESAADQQAFIRFRNSQFAAFKNTPEYQKALRQVTSGDDALDVHDAEEFIRQFHSEEYMSRVFDDAQQQP